MERLYIRTRDHDFLRCADILRCEPLPDGPKEKDDRVALFHIARLVHAGEFDDSAAVAKIAHEIGGGVYDGPNKKRLAGKFKKRRPFYMALAEYDGKIPLGSPYD